MKRRNFLRGLFGTGAVVVAAPVVEYKKDLPWPDAKNDKLSTGSFAKEISGGFEKHYEKMKSVYLNEIFTRK